MDNRNHLMQQMPSVDRERIDRLVEDFRSALENTWILGHIQGQMDSAKERIERLQGASVFTERRFDPRHDLSIVGSPLKAGQ